MNKTGRKTLTNYLAAFVAGMLLFSLAPFYEVSASEGVFEAVVDFSEYSDTASLRAAISAGNGAIDLGEKGTLTFTNDAGMGENTFSIDNGMLKVVNYPIKNSAAKLVYTWPKAVNGTVEIGFTLRAGISTTADGATLTMLQNQFKNLVSIQNQNSTRQIAHFEPEDPDRLAFSDTEARGDTLCCTSANRHGGYVAGQGATSSTLLSTNNVKTKTVLDFDKQTARAYYWDATNNQWSEAVHLYKDHALTIPFENEAKGTKSIIFNFNDTYLNDTDYGHFWVDDITVSGSVPVTPVTTIANSDGEKGVPTGTEFAINFSQPVDFADAGNISLKDRNDDEVLICVRQTENNKQWIVKPVKPLEAMSRYTLTVPENRISHKDDNTLYATGDCVSFYTAKTNLYRVTEDFNGFSANADEWSLVTGMRDKFIGGTSCDIKFTEDYKSSTILTAAENSDYNTIYNTLTTQEKIAFKGTSIFDIKSYAIYQKLGIFNNTNKVRPENGELVMQTSRRTESKVILPHKLINSGVYHLSFDWRVPAKFVSYKQNIISIMSGSTEILRFGYNGSSNYTALYFYEVGNGEEWNNPSHLAIKCENLCKTCGNKVVMSIYSGNQCICSPQVSVPIYGTGSKYEYSDGFSPNNYHFDVTIDMETGKVKCDVSYADGTKALSMKNPLEFTLTGSNWTKAEGIDRIAIGQPKSVYDSTASGTFSGSYNVIYSASQAGTQYNFDNLMIENREKGGVKLLGDESDVALDASPVIEFCTPMTTSEAVKATVTLKDKNGDEISYVGRLSDDGYRFELNPEFMLEDMNAEYRIVVAETQDANGETVPATTLTFTTAPGAANPTVTEAKVYLKSDENKTALSRLTAGDTVIAVCVWENLGESISENTMMCIGIFDAEDKLIKIFAVESSLEQGLAEESFATEFVVPTEASYVKLYALDQSMQLIGEPLELCKNQ